MRQAGVQPTPPLASGDVAGGANRSCAAPPEGEGLPSGDTAFGSSRDRPALRVVGSEAARQASLEEMLWGSSPNGPPGDGDGFDLAPGTKEGDEDTSYDEKVSDVISRSDPSSRLPATGSFAKQSLWHAERRSEDLYGDCDTTVFLLGWLLRHISLRWVCSLFSPLFDRCVVHT